MLYKVVHSKSKDAIVYRKFKWDRKRQQGILGFLSIVLLSVGVFMTVPTPEDLLTVGGLAKLLSDHYQIVNNKSIFYSVMILKGTGLLLIILSALLGGNYIRHMLIRKMQVHRTHSLC